MSVLNQASQIFVLAFGVYLVGLFLVSFANPNAVDRYLGGFASSARLHFLEQGVRIAVGSALILHADSMQNSLFFRGFGWVLVGTSVILLILPWRLHHRFAARAVPLAQRFRLVYVVVAAVLGALILWSALVSEAANG